MNDVSEINYPTSQLENVWLISGFEISDGKWGRTIKYADLAGLAAAILWAVVTKSGRLSGSELLYLRMKLDITQSQCAELLGTTEQTLSLWERNKYPIPISSDVLLRHICIEELRSVLPKGIRVPRTVSLAKSASPIKNGKYVCAYENVWRVTYQSDWAEQKADVTSSDYLNLFWTLKGNQLERMEYFGQHLEATKALLVDIPIIDVAMTGLLPFRQLTKIRFKRSRKTAADPATTTFTTGTLQGYGENPLTGVLYPKTTPTHSTDDIYEG